MKLFKKMKTIIEGFVKLIVKENELLKEERLLACSRCPLHHKNFCIKNRGGCGCYLPAKASHEDESCPHNVWYDRGIYYSNLDKVIRKWNKSTTGSIN